MALGSLDIIAVRRGFPQRSIQSLVSDIATDPLWVDYRGLALACRLRVRWSTPILSSEASVLETFAIYARDSGQPTPQHHKIIEQISHLASIAIERMWAEEKLRQSERKLRQFVDVVSQHIFVLGPDGTCLYTNQVAREYHGLTPKILKRTIGDVRSSGRSGRY
jgi:GAF domain-containing protein